MILIADGGSTSCDWMGIDPKNKSVLLESSTTGLNPNYSSHTELLSVLTESRGLTTIKDNVSNIYFFGAGCDSEVYSDKMKAVLRAFFINVKSCQVKGDIHGAVSAVTKEKAVVGILGTGSNICYFDGHRIHRKTESLGFSIMDDGGGTSLGRVLLREYYYKSMPEYLRMKFEKTHDLDANFVKKNLYQNKFPGRYLASHTQFLFDNIVEDYMKTLLRKELTQFFEYCVKPFQEELKECPLHFVGSVAFLAKSEIDSLCQNHSYSLGNIVRSPIHALSTNGNLVF